MTNPRSREMRTANSPSTTRPGAWMTGGRSVPPFRQRSRPVRRNGGTDLPPVIQAPGRVVDGELAVRISLDRGYVIPLVTQCNLSAVPGLAPDRGGEIAVLAALRRRPACLGNGAVHVALQNHIDHRSEE